jgi:polyisoprenoid-binding protein YceI
MKRSLLYILVLSLVPALGVIGCANPADDKPEAEVGEPVAIEESAAEAPMEEAAAEAPEAAVASTTYNLTSESKLLWTGSKVTGSHDGGFNTIAGTVSVIGTDPTTAGISIDIDATSLFSDSDNLTNHLKGADFFEVDTYPKATFISTSVEADGDGYKVTGNLDLHGVTKSISFPATIAATAEGVAAQAEFFIKRTDFGINYAGKADDLIRDEVVIKFDIKAA